MTQNITDKYVRELVLEEWDHLEEEDIESAIKDIQDRLASPEFLVRPQTYMAKWANDRGEEEDLRLPDDVSLDVMQKNLDRFISILMD
jgi:hypothetical protein